MKLNCFIRNTKIKDNIKNAILGIVYDLSNNDFEQKPTFGYVYSQLRKVGLEVDAESVGYLYTEVFNDMPSELFTSESDILSIVGRDIATQLRLATDRINGEIKIPKEDKIGSLSPEKSIAKKIGKMFDIFRDGKYPAKTKSVMKTFEGLVQKAMLTKIPSMPKIAQTSIHDTLDYFFNNEKEGFKTLQGSLNNLETLHTAVKNEVQKYIDGVVNNLDEETANMVREQYENYTEGIMNSMYDLMLGKGEQNILLKEALKQLEIDGEKITDKNGNILWSKLSTSGDIDVIKKSLSNLFQTGIKSQDGSVKNYTRSQADRIANFLSRIYENKLAAYTQRQAANERIKNKSTDNLAADFLKEEGYFGVAKKDGVLAVTKSDWKFFINELKGKLSTQKKDDILNQIGESFREFLQEKNRTMPGDLQTSEDVINEKVQEFKKLVTAKFAPSTATPNALHRLIAFKQLNNANAFQNSTQQVINKISGVNQLSQTSLDRLKMLAESVENIMKIEGGDFSLQALSKIDREIKLVIRDARSDKEGLSTALRLLNDYIGASTTTILVNPKNILENISTAFTTSATEILNQLMINPKIAIKEQGLNMKIFWSAWVSHILGGAHTSVMTDNDISIQLPRGEVYTIPTLLRNIELSENKFKQVMKEISKSPLYMAHLLNRILLNSFDTAFNAVILRRQMSSSFYNSLLDNGYSKVKALEILDEALNIPGDLQKQITDNSKLIETELNKVGLYLNASDKALMAIEMRNVNFDYILQKYKKSQVTDQQVKETTRAILKSSSETTKALTGKKKINVHKLNLISQLLYSIPAGMLKVEQGLFDSAQNSREKGNYGMGNVKEFIGSSLGKNGFSKFVGGRANFAVLGVGSIPIVGAFTAMGVQAQLKNMLTTNNAIETISDTENFDKFSRYNEQKAVARAMWVRQATSLAMTAIIAAAFIFDDDDEEGWFDEMMANFMETKSGQKWIAKEFPTTLAAFSMLHYSKKDSEKYLKLAEIPLQMASVGQDNQLTYFMKYLKKSKGNKEAIGIAVSKFIGSTWNGNINQLEQITATKHILQSGFDRTAISDIRRDEAVMKKQYASMDDIGSAYMNTGIMTTAYRIATGDANRLNKK